MARKSTSKSQDEKKRPTLQMSHKEAESRIQAQIEKGKQFLQLQIKNESDLDGARKEKRKWSD